MFRDPTPYWPSPPEHHFSDDDKIDLTDYEYSEYFKLCYNFEIIRNNKKIQLTIYFKGEARQIIDDEDNAQICEMTPDYSQIYAYDEDDNNKNYIDEITKEEKKNITQLIKKACNNALEDPCQETNPDFQPVQSVPQKNKE